MKTVLLVAAFSTITATAFADQDTQDLAPAPCDPCVPQSIAPMPSMTMAAPIAQPPAAQPPAAQVTPHAETTTEGQTDEAWGRPAGKRFSHGFRLGWTYIQNWEKPTRENGMSLKEEFKLKTPNMMVLGYEGFYRIIGHSWLNVLMVGNVTIVGLEQSKFIPAASGLIGVEFDHSFQLGVGVNLTPDPQSPSHMIAAAGWTPRVGSIHTPIHFFYVPDAAGNSRMGATVGMNW